MVFNILTFKTHMQFLYLLKFSHKKDYSMKFSIYCVTYEKIITFNKTNRMRKYIVFFKIHVKQFMWQFRD